MVGFLSVCGWFAYGLFCLATCVLGMFSAAVALIELGGGEHGPLKKMVGAVLVVVFAGGLMYFVFPRFRMPLARSIIGAFVVLVLPPFVVVWRYAARQHREFVAEKDRSEAFAQQQKQRLEEKPYRATAKEFLSLAKRRAAAWKAHNGRQGFRSAIFNDVLGILFCFWAACGKENTVQLLLIARAVGRVLLSKKVFDETNSTAIQMVRPGRNKGASVRSRAFVPGVIPYLVDYDQTYGTSHALYAIEVYSKFVRIVANHCPESMEVSRCRKLFGKLLEVQARKVTESVRKNLSA
jgi:hypothetical protein